MWLLDYITENKNAKKSAESGKVSYSNSEDMGVISSNKFQSIKQVFPYGVISVLPEGEEAVVLPLKDSRLCLGTVSDNRELKPGELLLYSKGGASILLSNDGKVYINGEEI